jgi:hypothetical protein
LIAKPPKILTFGSSSSNPNEHRSYNQFEQMTPEPHLPVKFAFFSGDAGSRRFVVMETA